MQGSPYPPDCKRYYSVFRYGDRSTVRYFTDMKYALEYYDKKCRVRNFRSITLNEYDMSRSPVMKELYSTSSLFSNGAKIRDIGKR